MRGFSYGAVVGGILGVFFGWAPAFLTVVVICGENTDLPFLTMFFGLWTVIAVLATATAAGIGYVLGRRIEDE